MHDIVIVDYGMGNLNSANKAIKSLGGEPKITDDPNCLAKSNKIILVGVGGFNSAIKNLKESGLLDALNYAVIDEKIPILGICLGMQIMGNSGEEGGYCDGLGWIDGKTVKFNISNSVKYKVPNMGWNNLINTKENKILEKIGPDDKFYFAHSYHMVVDNNNQVLSNTMYENKFVSSVNKDNIYGVQFHPEKSHDSGKKILLNFLNL